MQQRSDATVPFLTGWWPTVAANRLTDKQVKQCIAVLDTDGDGEVSLSEFMVLVNEPMKSAVKKIKAVNAIKSFSKE